MTDANAMALRLTEEEGLFAGTSSGANVVGAIRVGQRLGPAATAFEVIMPPAGSNVRMPSDKLPDLQLTPEP